MARTHGQPVPALIHALGRDVADLAAELALRWRCPYLLTIDDFLLPGNRLRLARKWCLGVTTPSHELAADLIQTVGLPSRLVTVVPPGVPRSPIRTLPSPRPRVPVVGTAVGASFGSGLPTFLEAARLVLGSGIEAEFVLADPGSGTGLARRLADALAVAERLTITEGIALEHSFWPVLDVYAQTSRLPSTGRPLRTALSHGIPAIACDVAGLREIAGSGQSARVVPPGDAKALATEILDLLSHRDLAAELGNRARSWSIAEYSPEREADSLAALYRTAIVSSERAGVRVRSESAVSTLINRRS